MALLEDDLEDDLLEMESAARNEPCRQRWVWVVYALLFASSVPWYLPGHGSDSHLVWPASLGGSVSGDHDWYCTIYRVCYPRVLAGGRRTRRSAY